MSVGKQLVAKPVLLAAMAMAVLVLAHCGPQESQCTGHDDCASGEYCVTSTGACEERRTGGGTAGDGESCESRHDCIEGLLCSEGACSAPTTDECETSSDCPRGTRCSETNECIAGCTTTADCAADEACDLNLAQCVHCTLTGTCGDGGGDGDGKGDGDGDGDGKGDGDGNGDGGGTTPECTTKYDCSEGQVCQSGNCRTPTSNSCRPGEHGSCARGQYCNFTGQCESGCSDSRDCADGLLCNVNFFECMTCSAANPCPTGEICIEQACVASPSCSSSSDCASVYDGSICRDGACTTCSGHASCNTNPYASSAPPKNYCSDDGLCVGHTCSDTQCKEQNGERYYCHQSSGTCREAECLSDTDCTVDGQACDLNSYTCTTCHGTAYTQCQAECSSQGMTCDTNSCGCVGSGGGGTCTSDADCSGGLACVMEVEFLPGMPFAVPCDMGGGLGGGACTCGTAMF